MIDDNDLNVTDNEENDDFEWLMEVSAPYQAELFSLLDKLPDTIEVPISALEQKLITHSKAYGVKVSTDTLIVDQSPTCSDVIRAIHNKYGYAPEIERAILNMYDITILNTSNNTNIKEFILDLNSKNDHIKIILKKNDNSITEQHIKDLIKHSYSRKSFYYRGLIRVSEIKASSIRSIVSLLNIDVPHNIRSKKSKIMELVQRRVREIFENDEFRIIDADLAVRAAQWTNEFLINNDLSAFIKLTRLKNKAQEGKPISNIDEEV